MKTVKLTHPTRKRAISVPEDRVEMYRTQGWQTPEDKKGGTPPPSSGKDEA